MCLVQHLQIDLIQGLRKNENLYFVYAMQRHWISIKNYLNLKAVQDWNNCGYSFICEFSALYTGLSN